MANKDKRGARGQCEQAAKMECRRVTWKQRAAKEIADTARGRPRPN